MGVTAYSARLVVRTALQDGPKVYSTPGQPMKHIYLYAGYANTAISKDPMQPRILHVASCVLVAWRPIAACIATYTISAAKISEG